MRWRRSWALLSIALVATLACGGGTSVGVRSPTAVTGGLAQGLIAYVVDQGVGVLDPATGKSTIVAPLPAGGAFRVAGPVWGPAPGVSYPVIYFAIHDDRPAESRNTPGVVPYDWLFRVDPFTGVIEPIAASEDVQSEGPIGLVANSHYVALTYGCCATYEVDALDVTQPAGPLKVLSRPPAQAAFFTEGAAPGNSSLIAVREFGTGGWYWLNADAGVLNPFPLSLGPDDGPIAITPDGSTVAVALPDHGAVIEPINVALPVATPSTSAAAGSPPGATPRAPAAPRHINSGLPHPDGLAWSPDAKQLAIAVNGELEIYKASGADGTAPANRYLTGANVAGVSWSAPIPDEAASAIKAGPGPQAMVDALLAATMLPAAADTPANRPFTKIYLWQFDSTTVSPINSIADATATVLAKYPPLAAGVVFHHWAASGTWALLGGCYRYRVVIAGSIPATPDTVGLSGSALCSSPAASPSASPSAKPT
ncbi:MAG TPA: hypothetical protein VNF26_09010 [Candidatus Baltobacterales bacterium]|nr:hypothetical protein [Candidatus Baltobacterales bacterium]